MIHVTSFHPQTVRLALKPFIIIIPFSGMRTLTLRELIIDLLKVTQLGSCTVRTEPQKICSKNCTSNHKAIFVFCEKVLIK